MSFEIIRPLYLEDEESSLQLHSTRFLLLLDVLLTKEAIWPFHSLFSKYYFFVLPQNIHFIASTNCSSFNATETTSYASSGYYQVTSGGN
jgi:hypothetical protein